MLSATHLLCVYASIVSRYAQPRPCYRLPEPIAWAAQHLATHDDSTIPHCMLTPRLRCQPLHVTVTYPPRARVRVRVRVT
jgi:hypothetical protein